MSDTHRDVLLTTGLASDDDDYADNVEGINLDEIDDYSTSGLLHKLREFDLNKKIVFADGSVPKSFGSYRGYNEQLAVGDDDRYDGPIDHQSDVKRNVLPNEPTVGEFIQTLEYCLGKRFKGYDGGEFKMSRQQRLWHSARGTASQRLVCGAATKKGRVVLQTCRKQDVKWVEPWSAYGDDY